MVMTMLFIFVTWVRMFVNAAMRRMTVFGTICAMGMGKSVVVLVEMFVGMAVQQLTMIMWMLMQMQVLVIMLMSVLNRKNLA